MSRKKTKCEGITYDDVRKCYYVVFDYGKDLDGNRIRPTKTYKKFSDAKKARDEFLVAKENGKIVMPSNITFGEELDLWLNKKSKSKEATTIYSYRNIVEKHIKPALGDIPVQELTIDDIEGYFYMKARNPSKDKEGLSLSTLQRHLEVMKGAFKYAKRYKIIHQAPTDNMDPLGELIAYADTDFEHVILEIGELKAFLAELDKNFFRIGYFIAAETGVRRGEIVGLKWNAINFEKGTILVNETRTQAGADLVIKAPKSKKGKRELTLTPYLLNELKLHKEKYEKNRLKYGDKFVDSNLVICHPNGKKTAVNSISNNLAKLRKKLDLRYFRLHDLRHTALSTLYNDGKMTDVQVAAIAGHSSANFTRSVYLGNAKNPSPAAAVIMNELLYAN